MRAQCPSTTKIAPATISQCGYSIAEKASVISLSPSAPFCRTFSCFSSEHRPDGDMPGRDWRDFVKLLHRMLHAFSACFRKNFTSLIIIGAQAYFGPEL